MSNERNWADADLNIHNHNGQKYRMNHEGTDMEPTTDIEAGVEYFCRAYDGDVIAFTRPAFKATSLWGGEEKDYPAVNFKSLGVATFNH